MIFDIQRFSIEDGPGIRTTVFLKGCSLNCAWCHNPESKSYKQNLSYIDSKCIKCKRCASVCSVHEFIGEEHLVKFAECTLKSNCVNVCPTGALSIIGKEMSVDEIFNIIMRDIDYYKNSMGGVTFSGGEPLTQPDLLLLLIERAKEEGIHICVETCGYIKREIIEKFIGMDILWLYDYKGDDTVYMDYANGDRSIVIENLDILLKNNEKLLLRCPIIPGINDTDEHFDQIKYFKLKYGINAEIMAYHDLGRGKAQRIGTDYNIEGTTVAKEVKQTYIDAISTE